ncbi:hypothetical protein ACQI5H_23205 [Mycobacterium heidelbergense]|uniref:hypothetical protein n=1 Tax=Mycobacterium heidelbergense TaxID=53376 RepID=UPI003CF3FB5D
MNIKQLLVSLVLTALGFLAGTGPYILALWGLLAAGYNFHAVGPTTFLCLSVAIGAAAAIYVYARNRGRASRMLLPFVGGVLLFFIVAAAVTSGLVRVP